MAYCFWDFNDNEMVLSHTCKFSELKKKKSDTMLYTFTRQSRESSELHSKDTPIRMKVYGPRVLICIWNNHHCFQNRKSLKFTILLHKSKD